MNKFVFASLFAASAILAQVANAQTPAQRDRAIARSTDARDMSTGLPMNAPNQTSTGALGGTARDRAIARLTDMRDMSTGFTR